MQIIMIYIPDKLIMFKFILKNEYKITKIAVIRGGSEFNHFAILP